jgi:hypothetical protein
VLGNKLGKSLQPSPILASKAGAYQVLTSLVCSCPYKNIEVQAFQQQCSHLTLSSEKKFYNIDTWCQCYKTYYDRNLQMLVTSLSVCPWQVFLA